jgi:heat shock protein HtpX
MHQLKTVVLGLLSGFSIAISYWIVDGSSVIGGIAIAAITNLLSWYQADEFALVAYCAQSISPNVSSGLDRMVQRLCDRGGLPMAAIFIVPTQAANAFATGRDPEHATVAVTEGILNLRSGYFC